MSLIEANRPKSLAHIAGHPEAVGMLQRLADRPGWDGDSFHVLGPTGVGKTSLASAFVASLAHSFDTIDLDGDTCTVDRVHELESWLDCFPMHGDWKGLIVNESHSMTDKAVQAWLTLLERRKPRRLIFFTTTEAAPYRGFTKAMLSRTKVIKLACQPDTRKAFSVRLIEIAKQYGKELAPYLAELWVQRSEGSMRQAMQELDLWL
ncbi:MAG: hypothetical protein KIPDCIKN_04342 [Haliscomenobacter sp.]|nr:hypothetical protein [Haliscomenobacter sp.]